jgi:cellulose synthase/poly-beta-1,6-N-acetylglucosamine synthase-like glycosyltransferase
MTILFIFSFSLLVYTYVLYPLVIAGYGAFSRTAHRKDETSLPFVTLIISAYNEEKVIVEKLRNTLALDYPRERLQIIVASESTDRTHVLVEPFTRDGIELHAFTDRRGKSATLARVIPAATGEVLVFSDANALYRTDAIRKLVRNFADPSVGAVVGQLEYRDPAASVGARGEGVYWAYDRWLRRHVNRVPGLVPGINGSIFTIRKTLYLPFSEVRGDDYELCTRIAIRGYRVVSEPEAIAEERADESAAQQFRRKMRLVRWNTMSTLLLLREALSFRNWPIAFQLLSHRLLRYAAPLWLVLALVSTSALAMQHPVFAILTLAQVVFYGIALVGWLVDSAGAPLPKPLLVPSYFLLVNTAALAGLFSALRYGQATMWQKAR